METIKDMTDAELLEYSNQIRSKMSYYNAAEGASYRQEAGQRAECRQKMVATINEVLRRGLELPKGNFLC